MPTLNRRKDNTPNRRQGRNNRAFYQSHRWHEYSRQYRKKNPLCAMCLKEGITRKADCVDHITPITAGGDMWNPINHQSLCTPHHNHKTKHERSNRSDHNER